MKNILILDNIFNSEKNKNIPNFQKKVLQKFNIFKLKSLINKLKNSKNGSLKFKIISNNPKKFFIDKEIEVDLLSDYRFKFDRTEFLTLKENIFKSIRKVLSNLFRNLLALKTFHINGIFIGNLLEIYIIRYLAKIFGEFELINAIIQNEKYHKIILFNFNPNYLSFFKSLNNKQNVETYLTPIIRMKELLVKWQFLKFLLFHLKGSFKAHFFKKSYLKRFKINSQKKHIIFIARTKNQIKSIYPIYKKLKKIGKCTPICYNSLDYEDLILNHKFKEILRFILQLKKVWIGNLEKITKNVKYNSLELKNVLKELYYDVLRKQSIYIYKIFYCFNLFIKFKPPSFVIITNKHKGEGRLLAKYCKLRNIPTIYVPHSSIAYFDEMVTKSNIDYLTVPGRKDKEFLTNRGELQEKIFITGRPRYELFYNRSIKPLVEIKDMYDNKKIYTFEPNKFTILLTTNIRDDKSNDKILSTVVHSLNKFNLLNNLIVKLHPNDNRVKIKEKFQNLNVNPIIVRDYDILKLIASSNLLLARKSTTILEAMIIGIPTIVLDITNMDFDHRYKYLFLEDEALITVQNQKELDENLEKIIKNEEFYKNYSKKIKNSSKAYSFFDKDESPTEKIVKIISSVIKNNIQ